MLTDNDLKKYDPSNMHKIYDMWPQIANTTYNSDIEPIHFDNIDHIVFAGMGGSGAIGDLFSSLLSKSDIHVSVVKGYLLPQTVDKNTLIVATSVSGDTAETLTVLNSTNNLDCNLIAFSSGGKMETFCKNNHTHFRKLDHIHSPRVSFCTYVYSILKTLNSILPITKNDVLESINELENIKNKISSNMLSDSNPALNLATWVSGIPLIYFPYGLQSVATRFKSSIQENAKTHAIIEDVVEACHNGIVSWEKPSPVQPILLRGHDDYIKTKERFDIVKDYFIENKIDFREINSVSGNILTKMITLIYFSDYTSIYKAIMSKTDPSPVPSIRYIKDKI